MTPEDVTVYALARLAELGGRTPGTRSLCYRQIGVRQQQLYAVAAQVNQEWAGVCATGALVDGALDLTDLAPPINAAERIHRVTIEDPGTSPYAAGDEVHQTRLDDPDAGLPPRVTIRDRVIRQVGTDLDGVVSLKVHYAKLPLPIAPTDGASATAIVIPDPHSELLVVDLTRYLVRKASGMTPDARTAALEALGAEEQSLLAAFTAYAQRFAGAMQTRFG